MDSPTAPLQGRIDSFEILDEEMQRKLGLQTAANGAGAIIVNNVVPGSKAYEAGLRKQDLITKISRQTNFLELTIRRNGRESLLSLNPLTDRQNALLPRPSTQVFPLKAEQKQSLSPSQGPVFSTSISKSAKVLANYNLELIVDRSMSMRKRDCPGFYSRWDWCGMQAEDLARQLSSLNQGINITTFAGNYLVYENQSARQITNIFALNNLQFGTCLGEPLQERLNLALRNRSHNGKATLIAVITDGVPHPRYEPQLVADVIIDASRRMQNPQDIKILFLQVGGQDERGRTYLQFLDNRLTEHGARFDIVQTVTFDRLQGAGLAQALADSVTQFNAQSGLRSY
ncbi:MAG: hypothetical protein K2X27_09250 [Candidatus Obscuribacterales bacterium]|nr:hypothetical protein [Candidatus Obscuribacterales bacterium]